MYNNIIIEVKPYVLSILTTDISFCQNDDGFTISIFEFFLDKHYLLV